MRIEKKNKDDGITKIDINQYDPLLPYALKEVVKAGNATGTLLRRKFAIGFSRSMDLIDTMEELGFISKAQGAKPREVYLTIDGYEQVMNRRFEDVETPQYLTKLPGTIEQKYIGKTFEKTLEYCQRFARDYSGHYTSDQITKLAKCILEMEPKEEE